MAGIDETPTAIAVTGMIAGLVAGGMVGLCRHLHLRLAFFDAPQRVVDFRHRHRVLPAWVLTFMAVATALQKIWSLIRPR